MPVEHSSKTVLMNSFYFLLPKLNQNLTLNQPRLNHPPLNVTPSLPSALKIQRKEKKVRGLLYGSPLIIKIIRPLLQNMGLETTAVVSKADAASDLNPLGNFSDIDIAFVDCREKAAFTALRSLMPSEELPLVWLVNGHNVEWEELFAGEGCGFVSTNGSRDLISCRLKAVLRRLNIPFLSENPPIKVFNNSGNRSGIEYRVFE